MTKAKGVTGRRVWQVPASLAAIALLGAAAVPATPTATAPATRTADAIASTTATASAADVAAAANPDPFLAAPDPRFQLARVLHQDDFNHGLPDWVIESERTAHVTANSGVLDIDTPAGLTLWFRHELEGPILIEYEASAVSEGGPNDRVSDLNSFWMATDPKSKASPAGRRSGAFSDYNTLRMYYVGLGGNANTTTRFRRYIASSTDRPLLPENDRSAPQDLLQPNHFQRIRIVADNGLIQYYRDDRKLFEYTDPEPYTHGWFALRTTQSHLRVRNFKVDRLVDSFHFSRQEPDGNYRVTLQLRGRPEGSTQCSVYAEARRLMIEALPKGASSFIVNVRTPSLPPPPANAPGVPEVRLPPAEINSPDWDNNLTVDIPGCASYISNVTVEPVHVPTVYLVGDSTVTDVPQGPGASWGQMLPRFFKPDVAIANHAKSGASLKSFLAELRLDKVLSTLGPGDWLMIQFGHNDQKKQWPQTYVEADTTYRAYLRAYIAEARHRGAVPVLITSPERRNFDDHGQITDSLEGYPDAVRAVAREQSVALIDLNAMSKTFYEALGTQRASLAFRDGGRDKTHHSEYGAYELARMVVTGIRKVDAALAGDLASHLLPDAVAFDPRKPDPPEHFNLAN
jgi:lysophospholipase L1-like esterase